MIHIHDLFVPFQFDKSIYVATLQQLLKYILIPTTKLMPFTYSYRYISKTFDSVSYNELSAGEVLTYGYYRYLVVSIGL